ncbi:MAG: phosphoglycerate dehydrogenase [Alphaproteobacteria bacterium]|jgi:D-3-phosphoglycerate dehydrogenase|nr:phosphoglycerate dehydrogenase [Alphaproteobacteria bacterium]
MTQPRVLIADKLSPRAADIFAERGIEAVVQTGLAPDQLAEIIGEFDGLAVRSATKVTAATLEHAPRLKVVGRAGIGVDNIDVPAATAKGVVVMNTPFGNSVTTAEHAVAMMLSLARQIPAADRSTRAGKWEKSRFMGVEVTGKVLGIIGTGNIGSIVASRALGLRMRVIAYDPFLSPERAEDLGIEKVDLDQLMARSDFVTVHTPLNDHTRNLIDAEALAGAKPGLRIINCARGGIVDEAALADALASGKVAGAALDVFVEEPAREHPLFDFEEVVVTPHVGASTGEAQENVALQVAEQMADYLTTGAVVNALNMASVSAEEAPRLRPYMQLCTQLGSFAGQLTRTGLTGAHITFGGDAAELNTRPLVASILEALLRPMTDSVNMVNAPLVARERDIDVQVTTRERVDGYTTLVTLAVDTENGTRTVSGTLVQDGAARIVGIRGIRMDAELGPRMLFVRNNDAPGLIGKLGTILGDARLNIANFHLGREKAGGEAIALLEVDQEVPAEVVRSIQAIPQVIQVQPMRF